MLAELIPSEWFSSLPGWGLWLLVAAAIPMLVFGADRAVNAAVRIASAAGMSKVIIGATVVSLGTTSPEASTSVTAAIGGDPGLALGNAVGSVICDTSLILGICLLMRPLPLNRFVLARHGVLWLLSGGLLVGTVFVAAALAGSFEGVWIGRPVGGLYLLLLVGYMYLSVRWARAHPELLPEEVLEGRPAGRPAARKIGTAVAAGMLIVLVSLLLVVAGSTVLVGSVKVLALRYGVPSDILAVTIVAFGTSLPEMVTSVTAVLKGHGELAVGNVIGADILNVLFVVGASSLAVPLHVPQTFFFLHLPIMTAALGVMAFYLYFTRGEHFHRWQGLPLLGVYAAYVVLLLIFLRSAVA